MIRKLVDLYNAVRDSIQDVRREQEEQARTDYLLHHWGGALERLSGGKDTVEGVCGECSFEIRNGEATHSRVCSQHPCRE